MLAVSNLTKSFGDLKAVDGLSLEVHRGEIFGFLGPNGAGKTTSLRMMCGLLRPDGGSVAIAGEPIVAGTSRGLRSIGVAPQAVALWDTLTCREQLELTGRLYDLPTHTARARADHLLAALGLADQAAQLGRTLSGGMQRRLNIALGLVHEPELLFLDEPQAGLDPQSRVLVRDYLRAQKHKVTVIFTTHDMEEAEKLCDRVCIIDHGKLLALDTVEHLTHRHGDAPLVELTITGEAGATLPSRLAALAPPGTFVVEETSLRFPLAASGALLEQVLSVLNSLGLGVRTIRTHTPTLEDVFLELTGRRLRE